MAKLRSNDGLERILIRRQGMTFDEWWKNYCEFKPSDRVTYAAREAWNAGRAFFDCSDAIREAIKAEREACIAEIDAANNCECGAPCNCFGASLAKLVITLRSNA